MRPAARRFLVRWGETALTALGAAVLLWQGLRLALWGGWQGWWLGWLLAAGGAGMALWCLAAGQRARLAGPRGAPGVVTIEEQRIGYWGPGGGGFVDMDDLERIELRRGLWVLVPAAAPPLEIPAAAVGAEALGETLAALPGFSAAAAADRLTDGARHPGATLWRRARPALARPAGPV